MKKNLKRTLAKVMAVALTVTLVGTATEADAAKKPKLSSKSVTVTKGKSKKVTIKNVKAKNVKKLTVKSANKKTVSVKKKGKTAFTVKGLKVSKKAVKVTATLNLKGKKKATKLTVKVKVKAAAPKKTEAPSASTNPSTNPGTSAAPGTSSAPGTSNAPAPGTSSNPAPGTSNNPPSSNPGTDKYSPVPPTQPEKPSTPAKVLPELNLREEAATEWSTNGSYGSVVFNTDDSVTYNSQPWAAGDEGNNEDPTKVKPGSCYNNGVAWYIDAATKGQVDLSAYESMELTIKTEAEVATITWGGSSSASSFWDKTDKWGQSTKTVENADGSKTITYPLEAIFGNANKVKKAIAVGITLKSDLNGDAEKFEAREGIIYGIKFIPKSEQPTTPPIDTPPVDTTPVDTPPVDTGSAEDPATPIATFDQTGFKSFADMNLTEFDGTKSYAKVAFKIKAYNADGDLFTKADENYGSLGGWAGKITIGNAQNTSGTDEGTEGQGDGIAMQYFTNIGESYMSMDDDGFITFTLDVPADKAASDLTGVGVQTASKITKIEIFEVNFTEKSGPVAGGAIATYNASGFTSFADMNLTDFDGTKSYSKVTLKIKVYNADGDLFTKADENYGSLGGWAGKITIGNAQNTSGTDEGTEGQGDGIAMQYFTNIGESYMSMDDNGFITFTLDVPADKAASDLTGVGVQTASKITKVEIYEVSFTEKN